MLREVGEMPAFDFEPRDHLEIGELLDAIDMARGAKVSGARFYYLKGIGARLELAIMNMGLDRALAAGFTPLITPTLVRPEIMQGTGFLGAHSEEIYYLPDDELYLTGTSEVALAGYHADEILDLSNGPLRYAGWSTCYRREAGSHGKDTRGIIRVHQFNKLEMFSYVDPADAEAEHERLLAWQEGMLQSLGLTYRVIDTAAGDLGSSAARKYDVEAWVPTQGAYRELTSTSNCTTFQARRLDIRHRTESGQDGAGRDPQRHARHDPVARRDPRDAPAGRRLGGGARGAPAATSAASSCSSPSRDERADAAVDARCRAGRRRRRLARRARRRRHDPARGRVDRRAPSPTRSSPRRERGHEVTLATGRSWATTAPVLERLELSPEYVVCANGAITMRRDPTRHPAATRRAHVETFDPTAVLERIRSAPAQRTLHGRDARRVPALHRAA